MPLGLKVNNGLYPIKHIILMVDSVKTDDNNFQTFLTQRNVLLCDSVHTKYICE